MIIQTLNVDYSRVEVAVGVGRVGARRRRGLGWVGGAVVEPPTRPTTRIRRNEADAVKSARLKGENAD